MKSEDSFDRLRLKKQVIHELRDGFVSSDSEIYRAIDHAILRESQRTYGSLAKKATLREEIFDSIRKLGILEKYLKDDSVTEIMVIGKDKIFVEKNGKLTRTSERFDSDDEIYQVIDQILAPINRVVNESSPVVDGRLPDGSRVHIVIPPISLEGPTITVRKFQKGGMDIKHLIEYESFPASLAPILESLVKGHYNILISGATNSGKSSLMNALSGYIGSEERIITIEDSAELQFFHVENLVRLESRNPNVEGENEVSMNDLIKASLRMRPNRIIVGEVRGAEATSMLQAFSTGHSGSLSSIHANSAKDALSRLETMVLMGIDLPLRAIRGQIASSIDIVIHLGRLRGGERRLLEIEEVVGLDGEGYECHPLFVFRENELKCVGRIKNDSNMMIYGQMELYEKAMENWMEREVESEESGWNKDTENERYGWNKITENETCGWNKDTRSEESEWERNGENEHPAWKRDSENKEYRLEGKVEDVDSGRGNHNTPVLFVV